jgi:hypothetical protein
MRKKSFVFGVGALVALGSAACGGVAPSEETAQETAAAVNESNLVWRNFNTGALSMWQISGATVTGSLAFDGECSPNGNCTWIPFATRNNQVWWWNRGSGQVSSWYVESNGHVSYGNPLTWTCDYNSTCADRWAPMGMTSLKVKNCTGICSQVNGVLWSDFLTTNISIWMLGSDGVTVTGEQTLAAKCGYQEGCTWPNFRPQLTADFDDDGNTDVLWWNVDTGVLTVWLLKDTSGALKGKQVLSWLVPDGWGLEAAGDVNGDGHTDLVWWHSPDGAMANWFLDGAGHVIGSQTLSWTCDSNCRNTYGPVGYMTFPVAPH